LGAWITDTLQASIAPASQLVHTFAIPADFSVWGIHNLTVKVTLTGDPIVANDSLVINIYNALPTGYFLADFESPVSFHHLIPTAAAQSNYFVLPGIGNSGTYGFQMTGKAAGNWPANTDTTTTAAQAFGYASHIASLYTCMILNNQTLNNILLLDLRQTYSVGPKYSWFRVLINDLIVAADVNGVSYFNPTTQNSDGFINHIFNLTQYGDSIKITLQASCRLDEFNSTTGSADNVFLDNINVAFLEGIPVIGNNGISLYPNPARDFITVTLKQPAQQIQIDLLNMQGQVISSENFSGIQRTNIEIGSLSAGVYTVKIRNGNDLQTLKFVKTL
ncbi:MAG: T9SS type A sorting domain-containing protein, partial [Bacteroidetes bacterium]|nr:T9SS type A sorting domain-containing protein [Bacteroidota bacterium]